MELVVFFSYVNDMSSKSIRRTFNKCLYFVSVNETGLKVCTVLSSSSYSLANVYYVNDNTGLRNYNFFLRQEV
jgi:hypothetical protein